MSSEPYGLFSSSAGPVPLKGVRVQGDIVGRGARVTVRQHFRNEEAEAIEAVYKFPLPEGAAVCGFKVRVGEREIEGEVEERERAFEKYDDALTEGHGGFLLDEERPNIFTLSVGNIHPGASAIIDIDYVILLPMEGPRVRFFLPTTISPRYVPGDMDEPGDIPTDAKIHPPYATKVPYGLSLALDIHQARLLTSIESPSHPVRIDMKEETASVTLSSETVTMDRDFILTMAFVPSTAGRAYRYVSGDDAFLLADLMIPSDDAGLDTAAGGTGPETEKEVVFLVDCSGSMGGDSIREAKQALEICLRGLEQGTAFNIYCFGSDFQSLFTHGMPYSEASLEKALAYIRGMDADLGGTEILAPLRHIFSAAPRVGGTKRDLILMTDGEAGNEDEILRLARKHQGAWRIFALGIGAGCNEYFIRGLSRAGKGAPEFIFPGERIEPKALRLFNRIKQNGLDEVTVRWGGKAVEQAPMDPPAFLGEPLTLLAKAGNGTLSAGPVVVEAVVNGQRQEWALDVMEAGAGAEAIPTLWARERIRDLEEHSEGWGKTESRRQRRAAARQKERILDLSREYRLISRYSSFVAVETREEPDKATGEPVLRKVPALITTGWHGMGGLWGGTQAIPAFQTSSQSFSLPHIPAFQDLAEDSLVFLRQCSMDTQDPGPDDWAVRQEFDLSMEAAAPESDMDILLLILSLQQAGGGMDLDEQSARHLGLDLEALRAAALEMDIDTAVDRFLLLATSVLMNLLETRFGADRAVWDALTRKTVTWLKETLKAANPRIEGQDLLTWVREYVEKNVRCGNPQDMF